LTLTATVLSAAVLTIVYWSGFALFDPSDVSWITRTAFYACCGAALLFVRRGGRSRAPAIVWTMRAAYCVLLAVLFHGANQARDILYGPERVKAELPGWLAGLELWWILCLGLVAVCLAIAAARCTLDAPARHCSVGSARRRGPRTRR
jgi:cytochrome bd-type quinol oxidase subunit 2